VAIGHQNHGGVAVAPAVALGSLDQALDLAVCQILAGPDIAILGASRYNCSFFGGWGYQLQVRFCHDNPPHRYIDCSYTGRFEVELPGRVV
jgi:hypothetical protein